MSTRPLTTADIETLSDHCVFMRSIYLHANTLFETSTAEEEAGRGNLLVLLWTLS
jgi:hypothetical protein